MTVVERDPGSFRDPESTVFYSDGRVLRGLSREAGGHWARVSGSRFLKAMTAEGKIIGTEQVEPGAVPTPGQSWDVVLEHETVPVVSYPFEWSFGMLRDAALLQLQLLLQALEEGITTKDGNAYNVQWRGSTPTFIDVASFVPSAGGPWLGYRQFCETFLNPLFLQAYRGVDFQPWLRGHPDGIPLGETRRVLGPGAVRRPGILKHVVLHSLLQDTTTTSARATQAALEDAGFREALTKASTRGLLRLVERLSWNPGCSAWTGYGTANSYSDPDRAAKARFVESALRDRPRLVLDLGCNDGTYARIAAANAGYVVAVDRDHPTVEALYRSLATTRDTKILPLVVDVAHPTPALGWRGRERRAFQERVRPDFVLCLALVHHLVIAGSVPLPDVVDWLRSFEAPAVVEFAPPSDPLVGKLLADKPAGHHDYGTDYFESLLSRRFSTVRSETLTGGRRLYHLAPR